MPDRRCVVYKTPLQRIAETALILLLALAAASAASWILPDLSQGTLLFAALILGFALVPMLGSMIARRLGAPLVSREERTRRYLAELGPIGLQPRPAAALGTAARRRRSLRR
jgi:hypothetical protein